MIDDLLLRWAVTVLFALSAAECLYSVVTHHMSWRGYISHGLHLVMSVAMLVMAWPFSMTWPTTAPAGFFVVATLWFVADTATSGRATVDIAVGAYHAVMMAAMAWMYAVMNGSLLPGMPSSTRSSMSHSSSTMPGMSMPDTAHSAAVVVPGYVTAVNWIFGVGFVAAAAVWCYVYFARRARSERPESLLTTAGEACQAFMAAGMAIMFLVMVV